MDLMKMIFASTVANIGNLTSNTTLKTDSMTFLQQTLSILLLLSVVLQSCKSQDPNFRYVRLEDFKYSQAAIEEGTEIQILSFSGGKDCTPEESYYYQFIGINLSTNDTVRILAPCQNVDINAKPERGTFTPWQETGKIIDNVLKEHGEKELISEKKFVVFNNHQKDIEDKDYKTAIGTLGFK